MITYCNDQFDGKMAITGQSVNCWNINKGNWWRNSQIKYLKLHSKIWLRFNTIITNYYLKCIIFGIHGEYISVNNMYNIYSWYCWCFCLHHMAFASHLLLFLYNLWTVCFTFSISTWRILFPTAVFFAVNKIVFLCVDLNILVFVRNTEKISYSWNLEL
jgi:hypothetical protein